MSADGRSAVGGILREGARGGGRHVDHGVGEGGSDSRGENRGGGLLGLEI